MTAQRIVDIVDAASFGRVPPCADPGFDHRTCDYWEDGDRGSKAARLAWLEPGGATASSPTRPDPSANPFAPPRSSTAFNPFAAATRSSPGNPFGDDDHDAGPDNPFAPPPAARAVVAGAPRKLALLARGLAIFGSYAKVLEIDGVPSVYAQFGPLSAYPRAQRTRELYPRLPAAPLPAVITCVATVPAARRGGHARALVAAVCDDLAGRGFAAVEAYPEQGARLDGTSAATVAFWLGCGFDLTIDDERFPVVRREL